ncbi:MAG TPA: 2Fe-2S iron-sulfur cluster-binding protein [Bryobacteraceae bacterium]|jgi:2Fe-2S ferredoxin
MPLIIYKAHEGGIKQVDVPVGTSVMQGAVKNGVDGIIAECGGNCMCATCHVYVDPGWLDKLEPVSDTEDAMLESTAAERMPNSRLSCQIKVTQELDGLIVTTPESQY